MPLYSEDDKFIGLGKTSGYIMVRGFHDEAFWSYGSFETKQKIPNIFTCAAFNFGYTNALKKKSSKNFFIMSSTVGRKSARNRLQMDKISNLSKSGSDYKFNPKDLVPYLSDQTNRHNVEASRKIICEYLDNFVKKSNLDLVINPYNLLESKGLTMEEVHWLVDISEIKSPFRIAKIKRNKWKFIENYVVS